ncbi:MAG: ATP-binding cassette domain-containing protein [Clostridia bacterium]|nr:ATP-binding cassette domain-containing protein [Clostridia bacterium]
MLKLCNIVKNYPTATTTVHALRGVSVEFRENEFVAILGPSGCGKTTMLNIIGGLDRYTSGDLVIGGISTASFDDLHWDAYRNATIGFVFQSYNLIPHLTVLENVELALSLSGEKKKTRRSKSIAALNRVGMAEHINKRPNQLSGGQMQRVAIARAIVNDPKIILADEPTGALDSELSVQVMEILQEISNSCLVIMVTHNAELAAEYATRTCRFKDGLLVEDTNPFVSRDSELDIDSDDVESEAPIESAVPVGANADESVSANGNENLELLTTDTVSLNEEAVSEDELEILDLIDIEESAHSVEPAADVDYEAHSAKDEEEPKNKQLSNRKRKKQMRNMHVDTREIFDKLGLNGLSKHKKKTEKKNKTFKPTSMNAAMAFGLSIRNLISKRKRTFLTAFAGSIGIIGLGLVLSISNGFNVFVDKLQTEMMAGVPLGMYEYNVEVSALMDVMSNMMQTPTVDEDAFPDSSDISTSNNVGGNKDIYAVLSSLFKSVSRNELTEEFDQYLRNMPKDYYSVYNPYYGVQYNIIAKELQQNGTFIYSDKSKKPEVSSAMTITTSIIGESGVQPPNWQVLVGDEENMLKSYDMLGGRYPQNMNELLLCVSEKNEISKTLLDDFGISMLVKGEDGEVSSVDKLDIDFFLNNPMSIRLVSNNDYYVCDSTTGKYALPSQESDVLKKLYDKGTELKIVGVIRPKKNQETSYVSSAICYTPELAEYVVNEAYNSNIAKAQRDLIKKENGAVTSHSSVFGGELEDDEITENTQIINLIVNAKLEWTSHLKAIGATKAPTYINVYPSTYAQKEKAAKYIAAWNAEHNGSVGYLDVSEMTVYTLHMMIDLMSIILIAVASISLVVSTVMIGVITSNSVVERTREIGILRSLGARKRDIRNVFVAETSLLGLSSGIIGIVVTYILCPLISLIIGAISGVGDLLHFHPLHAFLLVMASLALTVISGVMPAISASRKNVVDALRVD